MLRRLRLWLMVLPLVVAGGCAWFQDDDVLKPAELVDFEPTVELERQWTTDIGEGPGKRYTRFVPAFSEDRIFAAGHEGRVTALDRETGDRVWRKDLDVGISGAIGAGAGMVLVGTYEGQVIALSQEDGEELWRAQASSEILAPPQTNGNVVVVRTSDGRVFAYSAESGQGMWSYDHSIPALTLRTTARPLLTANQLFVGFDNGQLLCFNPENGVIQWDLRVGQPEGDNDLDRLVDVDSSPLLAEPIVYSAAYQGSVVAASRGTGRLVWKEEASTYNDMAFGNEQLYVVTDDSRVIAFGATSGAVAWENEQMLRRGLSAPATLGNYVATIDNDDYMHVLSQTDGSFAQRLKPPGNGFRSPLVSVDDVLYVFSDNGKLSAYRIAADD